MSTARFSFSFYYLCLLLVLALLLPLCFSSQNHVDADVLCLDDERRTLLQFKHDLIDEADRLASWVGEENIDCCKWAGIVCDNFTGHVHEIHLRALEGHCHFYDYDYDYSLSKQRLGGDINPSLLNLKQLTHLDLSCNDFRGIQIPKFIGSLGNLRYLNLSASNFSGIIPFQLGNLSKLHVFSLGSFHYPYESTSMMNMRWLSGLRLLHHLDMSGVDLNKAIDLFPMIKTLPSLVQLHLSNCNLSSIHLDVSSLNLTSLSLLDLSQNKFVTLVPQWIFSITSLLSLDLSYCHIDSLTRSSVGFRNLTSLESLDVSDNSFMNSSSVLKELSSSVGSNLVSLDISLCGVSDLVLDSLYNLTSLVSLRMIGNGLSNKVPRSLGNLCNLRNIDLSFNKFGNINLTYLLESFFECKSPALESLILSSNQISGPIPYSIGRLSLLEGLDLSSNQLKGNLPESLGQLSKLITLDLSSNQLKGNLPESLGQLSKLITLDLSSNQLKGNLPESLGQLSKLITLVLSYNQLNGSLPDWIGRLSLLRFLFLSFNQLKGSLPDSLGQLSKLSRLAISNNLLTGVVTEAHFAKLARLSYLNGGRNKLTLRPRLENWIPPFQLRSLYLESWNLGPHFPLWLQTQKELQYLDISNTHISSPMPHESFWRSFHGLYYLNMSHNYIEGSLLGIPSTLIFIDLSVNKLSGNLHRFLCSKDVIWISSLNLGNNHFTGIIPDCWDKFSNLYFLNFENNSLSGEFPRTLGSLYGLEVLNMHGNNISGILPSSPMNLSSLRILQLGKNKLVGSIPAWFGTKLTSLTYLNLRTNYFDGNIPHELCYLTNIQILDLANNNLSGNIPTCFNNFSVLSGKENSSNVLHFLDDKLVTIPDNLRESFWVPANLHESLVMKGREDIYSNILGLVILLDLSSNNFSGQIPSQLTTLSKLKSLNLSRNQLTGYIPEKIGDLKDVETLDLSMNKLFGQLPMSLSKLNFLSSFNVSYNNLTGRVPISTQLQSFNESCFFGNQLCGAPLTSCAEVPTQKEDDTSHGGDWGLTISIVLGLVVGFWIFVAPLMVSRSWRITYFRFLSELW